MNIGFRTDYFKHFRAAMQLERIIGSNQDFSCEEVNVIGDKHSINKLQSIFNPKCVEGDTAHFQYYERYGLIFFTLGYNFIDFHLKQSTIEFRIVGSQSFITVFKGLIKHHFEETSVQIKWYYSKDDYAFVPVDSSMLPVKEMYPFIQEPTLEEYYQRYLDSSASILLLIGPPGTGKTTFIKGLLHYAQASAILSYDPELLDKDGLFVDFISDEDIQFLILEDSDTFLSARTEGNNMMHRFLNVSNGLVSAKSKKLIFSTNLPSVRDIDSALIRPGRCFDILQFETLSHTQIAALSAKMGIDCSSDATTVAEAFHSHHQKKVKQGFGFNIED